MAEQNNGSTLFTVAPPPNNEIENYFHDPSNSKEVPLDCEGRAWNRTHYRYDAKNLPKTSVSVNGTLPVTFIGGQVVLTGAVTSITLPTATQLKTQIESVWGAGTSTFGYPWAWVVRTEFDNQTAGAVTLVMGTGDVPLPAAGITFPANSLSEVEFQILNSSPTATSIRVALLANSTAASGTNVTLTDGGTNETAIVDGAGPDLVIKDFAAGFIQLGTENYYDNIGSSFRNKVDAGTLYLTLPDTGIRNAGDIQFAGATDFITMQNALAALIASGGNTLFLPSYKGWSVNGTLNTTGIAIVGGGQGSRTTIEAETDLPVFTVADGGSVRYFNFSIDLGIDPTSYAVIAENSTVEECDFNSFGVRLQQSGTVRDCTFYQFRNERCINVDALTDPFSSGIIENCRFTTYNSKQLSAPTVFDYTSFFSGGLPWVSGTTYLVGDVVESGGMMYVLQTQGGGTSTVAPTGFTNTNGGADGYVWSYLVPYQSAGLHFDSPLNVDTSNISRTTVSNCDFTLIYAGIDGSLGNGLVVDACTFGNVVYGMISEQEVPFRGLLISGCSFTGSRMSIYLELGSDVPKSELVITGCSFQDTYYDGVRVDGLSGGALQNANFVICGNSFSGYNASGNGFAGLVFINDNGTASNYMTNISITGNTFLSTTSDYAIHLDNQPADSQTIRLVCTSNCVFLGGTVAGINNTDMPAVANQVIYDNNV